MAGITDDPSIELPLDSPNWLALLAEAYPLLCSLLGERNLAAKELTDAMADDDDDRRVRSMRRCFAYGVQEKTEYTGRVVDGFREVKVVGRERVLIGPECELLPREYWIEHRLDVRSDGVFVVEGFRLITTVKGYAFFVWKPDLARRWPTIFGRPTPAQSLPSSLTEAPRKEALEEIAAPATSAVLPDDPAMILEVLGLKGPQQRVIAEAVRELHGRDPPALTTAKLKADVRTLHDIKAAKARARGDTPLRRPPGWDACDAFVKALHAWRAKQRTPES